MSRAACCCRRRRRVITHSPVSTSTQRWQRRALGADSTVICPRAARSSANAETHSAHVRHLRRRRRRHIHQQLACTLYTKHAHTLVRRRFCRVASQHRIMRTRLQERSVAYANGFARAAFCVEANREIMNQARRRVRQYTR